MTFLKAFAAVAVVFLAIDLVWITRVMRPLYEQQVAGILRPNAHMGAAVSFYVTYCAGIVYFAVLPSLAAGARQALIHGALFGAVAYGTFVFTNWAVIEGWTAKLVFVDLAWGTVLTAVAAWCGRYAARLG